MSSLTEAVGAESTVTRTVTSADTAIAVGSGDLPVLATPLMIALMEQAACAAIGPYLPDGMTSVGTRVEVRHRAPSPIGSTVHARATVTSVDGARVAFTVRAWQDDGAVIAIGDGTHTRAVIDRAPWAR
ncbi:MAG: thioesterase family protein [Candidatus Nanopelagicales bacterium]